MRAWVILVGLVPLCTGVLMADPDPGTPEPSVQNANHEDDAPGIMWNVQAGVFLRLGGNRYRESAGSYMGTLDLSWLKWDREHRTWGLGVHGALSDDGGPRFAPKALYRIPLKRPGAFFQTSMGVYLVAIDQEMNNPDRHMTRINLPGYFLETELGYNDSFSVVAGAETLPLDIYGLGVYSAEGATPSGNTAITNFWLGAKGGQVPGLVVIGIAGLVLAICAASFPSSF